MKRLHLVLAFAAVLFLGCSEKSSEEDEPVLKSGWVSRYWDGCKQSCSWTDKPQNLPGTRCRACQKDGVTEITGNATSSCPSSGSSYTCFDFIPHKVDENLAYAFAAAPTDMCGKCFEFQFDGGLKDFPPKENHKALKGKRLIVIASNMGGDVNQGQFDVLIPGGGVGRFNSFSDQIGVSTDQLGETYGGLLSACEKEVNYVASKYEDCLRNKCNIFANPTLKEGCLFYVDWFKAAGNPTMLYKEVECPQYLIDKYRASMP